MEVRRGSKSSPALIERSKIFINLDKMGGPISPSVSRAFDPELVLATPSRAVRLDLLEGRAS